MHFEILVEDQSGKAMLDLLVPRMIDAADTYQIHAYKGVGRIPKGLNPKSDPEKRILLERLPRLLRGYGKAFAAYPADYRAAVIVVCDLDRRSKDAFRKELRGLLDDMQPAPDTAFCLAIEEGEAWLLGDLPALKRAYPRAKDAVLSRYQNDSICGTWELLADALYPGGAAVLNTQGYHVIGEEKSRWAKNIAPHMEVARNRSPSFTEFAQALRSPTG